VSLNAPETIRDKILSTKTESDKGTKIIKLNNIKFSQLKRKSKFIHPNKARKSRMAINVLRG